MRSALLLVLALAGCVGTDPLPAAETRPDADATTAAGPPILREYGCHTAYVFFQEPPGWSDGRLPEGFTTVGTLQTKAWTCASARIGEQDVGPTQHAIFYQDVDAPAAWGGRGYVVYGWITDHAEMAAVLASWDLPVEVGEVDVEVTQTPAGAQTRVVAQGEAFRLDETTVTGPMRSASAYVARYFAVRDGEALAAVDIPVSAGGMASGGLATVELAAEGAPYPSAIPAGPAHQAWGEDELAYEWHFVPAP